MNIKLVLRICIDLVVSLGVPALAALIHLHDPAARLLLLGLAIGWSIVYLCLQYTPRRKGRMVSEKRQFSVMRTVFAILCLLTVAEVTAMSILLLLGEFLYNDHKTIFQVFDTRGLIVGTLLVSLLPFKGLALVFRNTLK